MYSADFYKVTEGAKKKIAFLKDNKVAYFIAAMLAGFFVGLAIILAYSIGSTLSAANSPYTKTVMGIVFCVALTLVMFAGAELFTGNNFVMAAGYLKKEVTLKDTLAIWIVSYLGNFVGSILVAALFFFSGLGHGAVGEYMGTVSNVKINVPWSEIIVRGILCNILVCLAVWCFIKMKEEIAKLLVMTLCLLVFVTSGFEHSVANMSLFFMSIFEGTGVTLGGAFYNIIFATVGNIVGGALFVALPYYMISKTKVQK